MTECTCIRTANLTRLFIDPDCPAPTHLWDEIQESDQ